MDKLINGSQLQNSQAQRQIQRQKVVNQLSTPRVFMSPVASIMNSLQKIKSK